tara:strand:- start:1290 stop:2405 length:1116 start_codon:yes stop_codon:yes gene_type:complete
MSKNKNKNKNKSFNLKEKMETTSKNNNWYDFFYDNFINFLSILITSIIACNLIFLIHIPKEISLPTDICSYPYADEKRYNKTGESIFNLAEPYNLESDNKNNFANCETHYKINEQDEYLKDMYESLKYKNQSLFYKFLQNIYRGGHAFRSYHTGAENIPMQHSAWHMRAYLMVHRNFRDFLGAVFDNLYSFSDNNSYCKSTLFIICYILVFLIHFGGFGYLILSLFLGFALLLYCTEMLFGGSPGIFAVGFTPIGFLLTPITCIASVIGVTMSALWLYYKSLLVSSSRKVILCLLKNNGYLITLAFGLAIVFSAFKNLNKINAMVMLILFIIMGFQTFRLHINKCKDLGKEYICDSQKFFDSVKKVRNMNK